jgi:hypothetical protein
LIDSSSTAITKGARRSFPDGTGVFRLAMLGCLFLGRGTVRIGGESSSNSQRRAMPALAGGMGVRCNRAFHGRSPAAKNGGSGYCFGEQPINKQRRENRIRTRSCAPSRSTSAAVLLGVRRRALGLFVCGFLVGRRNSCLGLKTSRSAMPPARISGCAFHRGKGEPSADSA